MNANNTVGQKHKMNNLISYLIAKINVSNNNHNLIINLLHSNYKIV